MEVLDDWAAKKEQLSIIGKKEFTFSTIISIINCIVIKRSIGGQWDQKQTKNEERKTEKNKK